MTNANLTTQEIATFGGGCFWCTEAIFQKLKGVDQVVPGYAGGARSSPSYEQVSTGATGHVEVVRISYDPSQISYRQLLDVFWHTHNPTTLNQQGADIGTQYRSVVFYHNQDQRRQAEETKQELDQSGEFSDPIVTSIEPLEAFYTAEEYHHNYYQNDPTLPYCTIVIKPKLKLLLAKYGKEMVKV